MGAAKTFPPEQRPPNQTLTSAHAGHTRFHAQRRGMGDSQIQAPLKNWWMMIQKKTDRDSVIDEIHRTRERMAEKFGGDIAAILEDARTRQEASGRAIWQGPSSNNAPNPTGSASAG